VAGDTILYGLRSPETTKPLQRVAKNVKASQSVCYCGLSDLGWLLVELFFPLSDLGNGELVAVLVIDMLGMDAPALVGEVSGLDWPIWIVARVRCAADKIVHRPAHDVRGVSLGCDDEAAEALARVSFRRVR
jgi:hypothetical protein